MNKELHINALKLKRQCQENAWKVSGAKNLNEYVEYVNKERKRHNLKKV
jgi:uncharacterized protein YkwD